MDEDSSLTPAPLRNHFRDHKECEWHLQPLQKVRRYRGEGYYVLNFLDSDCSFFESLPVTNDDLLAISDSLRKDMGWGKHKFFFAGAWFFRQDTNPDASNVGHYLPTYIYMSPAPEGRNG